MYIKNKLQIQKDQCLQKLNLAAKRKIFKIAI